MTDDETTGRTDLSDLLRARKEELGVSYRDLEAACVDPKNPAAGPQWRRGTLENLIKGEGVKAPSWPQLRALEAGFQLPLSRIQEAAGAQWFGIDTVWSEDEEVKALVHDYQGLDAEDRARVRALTQSWRKLKQD